MFFGLIQLTFKVIRDILLEMTAEFSYIHRGYNFIINFVEISMTLSVMCKFQKIIQCFRDAKTISPVVIIRVINETVAVLKSKSFWNRWNIFFVLRMDELENMFPLFVILVNLFETCFEIIRHFYQNNMVNG